MAKKPARDDLDRFHDYSIYLPSRTIYMGSEEHHIEHGESGTDGAMAERLIKNLHILDTLSNEPINISMNNLGGDVNHGLAIYDAIRACRSHVVITAYGYAMSMGSIILQAADERIMSPQASQMVHYGSMFVDKEAKTTYKIVAENKRIDLWMEQMYLEKIREKQPKFAVRRFREMLTNDTFLTAEESVELGLCDSILEYPRKT